ncbi:MAG: hypothetical protein ACPGSB_03195 [Opitutales bacterium]
MKKPIRQITLSIAVTLTACILIGCENNTQTTSGKDYISKYEPATPTGSGSTIDEEVREIASVEPILRFPARIGLAKIYNGQIANLSELEAKAWNEATEKLGSSFGEFLPVSPLIAEMVYKPNANNTKLNATEVVRKIRLGAARQHLDAVLIYEVFSQTDDKTLPTAVAVWTIIGAYIVPSEESTSVGYANALLVDVRNGYPYGTASASATETDLSTMVNSYGNKRRQGDKAQVAAALNLVPEVVTMFENLQRELK